MNDGKKKKKNGEGDDTGKREKRRTKESMGLWFTFYDNLSKLAFFFNFQVDRSHSLKNLSPFMVEHVGCSQTTPLKSTLWILNVFDAKGLLFFFFRLFICLLHLSKSIRT